MTLSLVRGGSDGILREWLSIEESCSGRWWNHHFWKSSRDIWMYHLGIWCRGDLGLMVDWMACSNLDDSVIL